MSACRSSPPAKHSDTGAFVLPIVVVLVAFDCQLAARGSSVSGRLAVISSHNKNDLTEAVPQANAPVAGEHFAIAAYCVEETMVASKLGIFIKRVEDSMSYLMGFQGDHLIRAAYKVYPDPSNEIHERSERGESPIRVASEMLRTMFVADIEKLPADQRESLGAYLASPGKAPPSTFAKVCRMYCAQIYIAKDAKQLDEQWCLDCVHDVFFAAQGLSAEERRNDRMRRPLGPRWMAPDQKAGDAALP